jgi:NADP-dependent alcohol dehydrogenase
MQNFTFFNPTRVHFGKGEISKLAEEIKPGTKVLVTYGGGSIKRNGVYDQVMGALKDCEVTEFQGIEPNPEFETCMKVVDLIKEKKIEFVLAVGGGSIIDGCKFIVAAVEFDGNPFDILTGAEVKSAMPLGTVLTLPATGSETNYYSVISRRATGDKLAFASQKLFPVFSILDPTTTYTLPMRQVTNGIVDAFTHTMEQYLTFPANAPLQDRFAEGIVHTLTEEGPKVIENPKNYDAKANVMWCATMALNTLIGSGVPQDWSTHMIGHEITAYAGLDHAQTLAVVLPNMMDYKRTQKREKLLQYAERIWNIKTGTEKEKIDNAITKTRQFFEQVGIKTSLKEYNVAKSAVTEIISKLKEHNMTALGEHQDITLEDSKKILEMCF